MLEQLGLAVGDWLAGKRPSGAAADDLLDAAIALWTAERFITGDAQYVGDTATDDRGLRMRMWF